MEQLIKPVEIDRLLDWPLGKSSKLAKQGKIAHLILPDGAIRFSQGDVEQILTDSRHRAQPQRLSDTLPSVISDVEQRMAESSGGAK